jgi:pantoate--beta-alanine ligase
VRPGILTTVDATREAMAQARGQGRSIGLVPTMGALHAGHVSLIRAARKNHGCVVVSIFVNPAQFAPGEDLQRYPRPFAQDIEICAAEGVDYIFHPDAATLYPSDYRTYVEVHELQDVLCGASRPNHFRGVATVVLKLFNIVQPDRAYFGQKDAQQVRIIQQMVWDLNVPVQIEVCPIVREADGLALSSRNQYLSAEQRRQATVLWRVLQEVGQRVEQGVRDGASLVQTMTASVARVPEAQLDYAAVVDLKTLQPLERLRGKVLVALAVRFGSTRLIDNLHLALPDTE